jgi:leucine dehydrogenase
MTYFEMIQKRGHEGVFFCSDPETGLRAIIAIHDTTLGPALGGCRMKAYSSEAEALTDVLRLSRAMTYKSSMAGLNLGGGKSVVILDKPEQKTPELLKAFAERISLLKGNYIGAGDVGSDTHDLHLMKQYCPYITGLAQEDGGLGDSSILTSLGVFKGIQAAVKEKLGRDDLEGLKVAIQGAGKVGFHLLEHLLSHGCKVYISDINEKALAHVKEVYPAVEICDSLQLYDKEVDVFSPNAIGGIITEGVAHGLKAKILAGGANNPLSDEKTASILHQRGILYAPDFVINAGGVIMVACELEKKSFEAAEKKTLEIYDTTLRVFEYAKSHNLLPWDAARELAVKRIVEAQSKGYHYGRGKNEQKPAAVC